MNEVDNHQGELGSGPVPRPAPVVGLGGVTQIVADESHTCALRGGEVWCWGSNDQRDRIRRTRPTSPDSRRTLMPRGCSGELVRMSRTTPSVSAPVS